MPLNWPPGVPTLPIKPATIAAADIVTPVWKRPLSFHEGGVAKFWGPMECSKTRAMIAVMYRLLNTHFYSGDRVFSNCWLDVPGAHWLRNDELKKVLRRAFNTEAGAGRWNKCIFLIMETDDLYSHLTQSDGECFQDLKKASQSLKRNIFLMYEVHEGRGVAKFLRDKTEISIRPLFDEKKDHLDLYVCNGAYDTISIIPVDGISRVNGRYKRFEELY